jgi:multidrug resistance efflux pump
VAEPPSRPSEPVAPVRDSGQLPRPAVPPRVATPGASKRRGRLLWLIPIVLLIGGFGIWIGYRFWYETANFVMTDNAQVAGDLVSYGSLNAGRIVATRVEVGDNVREGQELAVVSVPQQVGSVPFSTTPLLGETGNRDSLASVPSPLTGVVAARLASPGSTVAVGQPIYALIDPKRLWVRANIEEDKVGRVQPGQEVEVHVDALHRTLHGWVEAVTPASAATFSLLPAQNTSGNYTKVTQLVPIRIAVDNQGRTLPLGTSVEVKIHAPSTGGWLPWQQ